MAIKSYFKDFKRTPNHFDVAKRKKGHTTQIPLKQG
jgi:hypothetical protein